jgi:diguanylate cyclase (GGDEF)-like protein
MGPVRCFGRRADCYIRAVTLLLASHLLFGAAVVLALAFHRHRAAQVGMVLWLMFGGIGDPSSRVHQAAIGFGPWLLLASAAIPEARMLSRRHALFALLLAGLVALTLSAPQQLFTMIRSLALAPLPGGLPGSGVLLFLAAFACGLRWFLRGQPVEFALCLGLLLAAYGGLAGEQFMPWYAAAAASTLGGIVWASYLMAFVDPLTGLPNRRALDETLSRLSGDYTLAMVDIDHFKSFNDSWGHDAGDIVLRAVGRGLRRHAGGRTFRYGGEEFCVVFANGDDSKAAACLDEARERVGAARILIPLKPGSDGMRREPKAVSVTVSAGCASRSDERRTAARVLKAADEALYSAKRRGRNRVVRG